jgi:hypothetical protein
MQQIMERVVETNRADGDLKPILYTIEGAQAASGFARSRLYELVGSSDIKAVKAGRRTMIVGDSLRAYLAGLPRADIRMGRKAA